MTMAEDSKENSERDTEQKDLMELVNGNGPWQWMIFAMIFVVSIPDGSTNMSMTFFAPNLDYWCARPQGINLSVQEWKEVGLPPDDSKCSRYRFVNISHSSLAQLENNRFSNETTVCNSWEFDDSFYTSTIVSQWNLVCDREWLVSVSKSTFIIGYIFSSSIFAYLADRFGRKPIAMLCNVLAIISGICTIFSTSFLMFAIARAFAGIGVTGTANITFILLLEIITPEHRSPYFMGIGLAWVVGALHLPLIAWLLRDWIWMETVILIPSVLFLFCWWWFPESPHWLAHGKRDQALKVLSKAAKMNGVDVSDAKLEEILLKTEKSYEDETPGVSVMQLFHPELRLRTLAMWFIWSATAFVYYGITYNTNELAGNPFVNFTLYNLTEVPATILSFIVIQYKGRRWPLSISLIITALCSFLVYLIPADPWWIRTSVSLLGICSISGTFGIIGLFTAEIFPTLLRNIGVGSASTVARFAASMAPFVRELERATHPVVPQILYGVVCIISAGLSLLLPETMNCSIPDTIKEAAKISRKNSNNIQRRNK
ncbi:organic cation transporter-like protein isoform X1 [Argiope bruennichi]|uniref:organic cation transporter-like protein isoform X1 n=1 Tax=Argiope bruennichi TaxID=94029 RepID=UPI002495651F|nr:organic cation transporter-like protein isoform X1 [Argiope bruennichi]XP_055946440.1 organic cation transporter-like protein isoform X1 [Argiope bruennichi]XP_055946441.1 organic cation transporter-like protein isoform X1 [Argiope bruennichi]